MDILRYSCFGQIARIISNGRVLPLPPQKQANEAIIRTTDLEDGSLNQHGNSDTLIVEWDEINDHENPQNWGPTKRYSIALLICLYTFAVYVGSSIYTPGQTQVMEEFQIGSTEASLGLALYVLFYGIGTLVFSPLSEIPIIGRTILYVATFAIFVILLVPTALSQSFAGFLVLRCLLAFFGSPCLATSGATFQDIFPPSQVPYAIAIWSGVATCGPSFGPLLAAYSVPAKGWRWSQWELLWLGGPVLILMVLILPETSPATILTRRAQRLRKATGNNRYKAQAEIDQHNLTAREILFDALIKPWEINILDPAVLYSTLFTGLLYGIVYTWFEAFPIVYGDIYGFDTGAMGLSFLSIFVAVIVWIPVFTGYFKFSVESRIRKEGIGAPEKWLKIGIAGGWLIPVGLFLFAFTSLKSIHWIATLIGICLANIGASAAMQSMFLYVPFCYPKYAASLLAANALARSIFAIAAILYAPYMFDAIGIPSGVGMLAGLTVVFWLGLWILYRFGASLRARSRFSVK